MTSDMEKIDFFNLAVDCLVGLAQFSKHLIWVLFQNKDLS